MNKYLERVQEAIESDATCIVAICKCCMEALALLEASDLSPESKSVATKRMQRFIQDVYSSVPNQWKPLVQDMVQHTLFPEIAAPSPLLSGEENT